MPTASAGSIGMYYEETGAGPPLVLLHGLGGCVEDWEFQVPEFAKHFRVIVPELRGFGRTPRGTQAPSIPLFAADVWTLLERLGVSRFHLVGHSMGGAVAQQLALDHAGAVTRMVIANSVPMFKPRSLRQHVEVWYRLIVMRLLGPQRISQIGAARMYPLPVQEELRQRSIARGRFNTIEGYTGALRALVRWSALERLRELRMPVLVIASEHDYFTHEETVAFAHALPKGRYQNFPGMHHGLPTEAPGAFNQAVLKFLGTA